MAFYSEDRAYSDQFIPAIKCIVGPLLLKPATLELDTKEVTDLIVIQARDMRIAARVRRPGYAERYPFDFTLRAHRDTGTLTEMSKIINGFGDWLFYGHGNGEAATIGRWMVVNLHVLRDSLIRKLPISYGLKSNGDGTEFMWFDVRSFREDDVPILVAASFCQT